MAKRHLAAAFAAVAAGLALSAWRTSGEIERLTADNEALSREIAVHESVAARGPGAQGQLRALEECFGPHAELLPSSVDSLFDRVQEHAEIANARILELRQGPVRSLPRTASRGEARIHPIVIVARGRFESITVLLGLLETRAPRFTVTGLTMLPTAHDDELDATLELATHTWNPEGSK